MNTLINLLLNPYGCVEVFNTTKPVDETKT